MTDRSNPPTGGDATPESPISPIATEALRS
jgi:hypothetical protein